MTKIRDRNPSGGRRVGDLIVHAHALAQATTTAPPGVKGLGRTGDVIFTRPDGVERSVRETDDTAREALDKATDAEKAAAEAMTSANGLAKIVHAAGPASGPELFPEGSTWFQHDPDTWAVVGQWTQRGGAWVSAKIDGAVLAHLDAGSITTGALRGKFLASDAIDGKVITGATIQTAATGARSVLDGNGLTVTDGTNPLVQIGQGIRNGMAVRSPSGAMVSLRDVAFGTVSAGTPIVGAWPVKQGARYGFGDTVDIKADAGPSWRPLPQITVTPWGSLLDVRIGCTFTWANFTDRDILYSGVMLTVNGKAWVVPSANGKDEGGRLSSIRPIMNFHKTETVTAEGVIPATPGTPITLGMRLFWQRNGENQDPWVYVNCGAAFIVAQPI